MRAPCQQAFDTNLNGKYKISFEYVFVYVKLDIKHNISSLLGVGKEHRGKHFLECLLTNYFRKSAVQQYVIRFLKKVKLTNYFIFF